MNQSTVAELKRIDDRMRALERMMRSASTDAIGQRARDQMHRERYALQMREQELTPRTYLSTSDGRWRVIDQGMPLCRDVPDRADAVRAAKQSRIKDAELLPVWNGDKGEWIPTFAD
jgi:hypothetical protein